MIFEGISKLNKKKLIGILSVFLVLVWVSTSFLGCHRPDPDSDQLCRNIQLELVDWHICGLWVINAPVAWVRVRNLNNVPVKEITFEYRTYAADGRPLDRGTFTLEGTAHPHVTKNFIELYLGLVDLYTERLSIKLLSAARAEE